jgi:tetratricopeptide (TPR) repeat protein
MMRARLHLRASLAAVVLVVLGLSGCAKKAPTLPPAPAEPRYPEFVEPTVPAGLAAPPILERHEAGWRWLQSGDLRNAERAFSAVVKVAPDFYPSETGLGYAALARKDEKAALAHFDRAIVVNPRYAPALAGRGDALLASRQNGAALASFEAAVDADPTLAPLRSRIEVLRFQEARSNVDAAQKAAAAGKLADARDAYTRAIAASPQSAFLYRELAEVERRDGKFTEALAHAGKAIELDPKDARNFVELGEVYEAQQDPAKAIEAYTNALAIEPNENLQDRIDDLRERAAFAAMPDEYKSIESSATVTRAQLAALLGVRLDALVKRAGRRNAVLITDMRGNWAAPWIMAVARAGLMEVYPNHTFQPDTLVRRADLARAASNALSLIAADHPKLAAAWRDARRKFPDISPTHLTYPAASLAVEAGVMTTLEDGSFQLSRPVTGAEAVAAVKKLEELAERRP